MASASLLGLVIWFVIMINLNTWDKSIRVVESWLVPSALQIPSVDESRTLAFFQAERLRDS